MQNQSSDLLKTKQHFEILDGLRGVAAIAIVIFHFMEMAITDYSKNFIGHGFLAVDFFFCLSGFVIGYAYDNRVEKMGILSFFTSRLIRLQPLVISGSVLGLLAFLFDPFGGHPELYGAGKIAVIFLSSIFMIPYPVITERTFNLFGLNAPAWSLFWEYVANIFYALILFKINRRYLLFFTTLSAAALCFITYRSGSMMGGWGADTFWDGCPRICYSFLAGLLIYRSNWIIKSNIGFIALAILLALAFLSPFSTWNWLVEPIIVLFYFPLLIALGAGATLSSKLKKLCNFSGKISYPLYMTHYSVIWIFLNYYSTHKVDTIHLTFIVVTGTIFLIGASYLMMILYDIPFRKYLTSKRRAV